MRWLGLDGSESVEEATNGTVRFADLAEGIPVEFSRQGPWDWAMSIEVAEHVPIDREALFVHSLIAHARLGVILSWAKPNQAGWHHVNCQPERYIRCAFAQLGFRADPDLTHTLRGTVIPARSGTKTFRRECSWLRDTLMVFRRPIDSEGEKIKSVFQIPTRPTPGWSEAYHKHVVTVCNRTVSRCGSTVNG